MFYILWGGMLLVCLKMLLENNLDPKDWTNKNIYNERAIKRLGLSIDWDREISACSEEYYKHQQLFF